MFDVMLQRAPFPEDLSQIVKRVRYRPGWTFSLVEIDRGQESKGLTLDITTKGYNSHHQDEGEHYRVHHYMIVPAAAYNYASWRRWVFEQILLVERHEACEFFWVNGEQPYAPNHGPGWDPYIVTELTTETDRATSFRGEVKGS